MFAFVLGSNPALSIAEINSVLEKEGAPFSVSSFSNEALILEIKELEADFIKKLGGTIKIVEIVKEIKKDDFPEDYRLLLCRPFSVIPASLLSFPPQRESSPDPSSVIPISTGIQSSGFPKKLKFGISLYFLNPSNKQKKRVESSLKAMAINLKKEFQEKGIKTGFISKKERNLSSVSVEKNGLTKKDGLEVCIFLGQENIFIGKTISVQEFEEYSERDFGRPKRDLVSGTTPPKLAKIMINLAGKNQSSSFWQACPPEASRRRGQNQKSSDSGQAGMTEERHDVTFLDPFCGSGTYVNEAYLLGFKEIYGTDQSEKAVSDTKENLEWLKNYLSGHSGLPARTVALGEGGARINKESPSIHISQSDARELTKKISPNSIDLVVTESYLGKPQTKKPSKDEAKKILSELSKLYIDSLKEIYKLLKKDGVVVIALPAFKVDGELVFTPIEKELEEIGYKFSCPCLSAVALAKAGHSDSDGGIPFPSTFHPFLTPRNTYLYSRKDQIVLREILVLKK